MMAGGGETMGERGKVRRMDNSSTPLDIDPEGEDGGIWRRGQDHFRHFSSLLGDELDEETSMIKERWSSWSHHRLQASGLALLGLKGRTNGTLYGEDILLFEHPDRQHLGQHRFTHGDIVVISRSKPLGEKTIEGIVLERGPTRLRVVVAQRPKDLRKGTWRLDRGANRVAHDRMQEALEMFHSIEGDRGTILRDVLLGQVHDPEDNASMPPKISGKFNRSSGERSELNPSQIGAKNAAMSRRVTIIQGPPGTGKTHTAVATLAQLAQEGRGPILATAESNVAVDNLLEGLLELGVRAVRIGRPVKVRETLRKATLDAQLENHPKQDEIAIVRDEMDEVHRALPKLKGREKGLAHRDIQHNKKEIRRLEKEMIASVLDSAEVICSTNIGSGHRILDGRRFPIVLMDEATQAVEPSSLIPISKGCRQLILVGDHKQLPPTVISKKAEHGGLGRSLFERLIDVGIQTNLLDIQYRMHPVLREFPSARFYDDRLNDGCTAAERPAPAGILWPDWDHPFAFIPISGVEDEEQEGGSRSNPIEAARIYDLVQGLLQPGDVTPSDIGIITPYSGQVRALSDIFDSNKGRDEGGQFAGLEINTVDGYQGREKDVIIFSAVRSNPDGVVGFLSDQRRLNVAITRAKRGLVVVGDPQTLRYDHTWRSWLDWAEERGLFAWHLVNG